MELQKKNDLLHQFLQPEKGMLLLLEMVLHSTRHPDVLGVTEKRIENVNLFDIDVANKYVLNTRTLSASTALRLILLLLFFLFSFVLICKCVQGLCYCLCLFASVFEVGVAISIYLQVVSWFVEEDIYVTRINETSRVRCRTIIIGYLYFRLSLLFFLSTLKTLIIGYGLHNISIQINFITNCQNFVTLVQQQLVQL